MKVFQSAHTFTAFNDYLERKYHISSGGYSFAQLQQLLIDEGFNAVHQLLPVLQPSQKQGFFTLWNYAPMQLQWAKEKGWAETDLKKILFAQLEEFGADVFYNLSPIQFEAAEIKRLPQQRVKIAWFASPEKNNIDFSVYHTRFTNLPSDVDPEAKRGFRSHFFQLSDAPVFHQYTNNENRPIDVLFFGQYLESQFDKRNGYIDELIRLQEKHGFNLVLALMANYKYKYLLPFKLPLALHQKFKVLQFPPRKVAAHAAPPLFGAEMLRHIGEAKIVFNCHVDMAGNYRVNMRIFEALGCGAHMLSDAGIYPEGLKAGRHFSEYKNVAELEEKILYLLQHPQERQQVAEAGTAVLRTYYSKEQQWQQFQHIVAQFG
ncbi:MAG: glycosyltransferase [Lacibacter sp.]